MFQLYHHGDRGWVSELLARVEASGYKAVALTVDTQLYGRRERDILARWSPRKAMEIAPNPRGPDPEYQARLTWADVEWLMKTTRLPVGIKGIMTVRDARRAVDMGVRLLWVSNHGGRQLDQTQSTIDALPPIADAAAGAAEIVVDGGYARGTDVVKGLARGATVVAVGRAALWGLAADGAEGVARAMAILREEIMTTMGLSGRTRIAELTPDLIVRADCNGGVMGGPDMAPHTPQRSGHPGEPGAPLDCTLTSGKWPHIPPKYSGAPGTPRRPSVLRSLGAD